MAGNGRARHDPAGRHRWPPRDAWMRPGTAACMPPPGACGTTILSPCPVPHWPGRRYTCWAAPSPAAPRMSSCSPSSGSWPCWCWPGSAGCRRTAASWSSSSGTARRRWPRANTGPSTGCAPAPHGAGCSTAFTCASSGACRRGAAPPCTATARWRRRAARRRFPSGSRAAAGWS